jgi:hypothetical protein
MGNLLALVVNLPPRPQSLPEGGYSRTVYLLRLSRCAAPPKPHLRVGLKAHADLVQDKRIAVHQCNSFHGQGLLSTVGRTGA